MITRNLDTILIVAGFIFGVTYVGYLILKVKPENVRSIIQLTPLFIALIVVWIGMVLMEMKSGGKTVKEAVGAVAVQMFFVGLFILIVNLIRK